MTLSARLMTPPRGIASLALVLIAAGCVEPTPIGGTPNDSDGSDSDSGDPPSGDSSGGLPPPAAECPDSPPEYMCEGGYDCSFGPCGGVTSVFDADGCMRAGCQGPDDCPDGRQCVRLGDWGGAPPSSTFCETVDGECSCGATADGNPDVRVCVPDEEVPEFDAEACENIGEGRAFVWISSPPDDGALDCTFDGASGDQLEMTCPAAVGGSITLNVEGASRANIRPGAALVVEYSTRKTAASLDEWLRITHEGGWPEILSAAHASELLPPGAAADWWGTNFAIETVPMVCPFAACEGSPLSIGQRPAGIRAGNTNSDDPSFYVDVFAGEFAAIPGKYGGWTPYLTVVSGREGGCPEDISEGGLWSASVVSDNFGP